MKHIKELTDSIGELTEHNCDISLGDFLWQTYRNLQNLQSSANYILMYKTSDAYLFDKTFKQLVNDYYLQPQHASIIANHKTIEEIENFYNRTSERITWLNDFLMICNIDRISEEILTKKERVGKVLRSYIYEENEIVFFGEIIGKWKKFPVVKIFTMDFYDVLSSSVWDEIINYAGNSSSCWKPGGDYYCSSILQSVIHYAGYGKSKLIFAYDEVLTTCQERKIYIFDNNNKYLWLCGRLWGYQGVYYNLYHDTRMTDNAILTAIFGKGYRHVEVDFPNASNIYINDGCGYCPKDFYFDSTLLHLPERTTGDTFVIKNVCLDAEDLNFPSNYAACYNCGNVYEDGEMYEVDGELYCYDCYIQEDENEEQ